MVDFKFFAVREDIREILEFLFKETDCEVYETYSERNRKLRKFSDPETLIRTLNVGTDPWGKGSYVLLSLSSLSVGGKPKVQKIHLKDQFLPSHRFTMKGVALMSLQFGGVCRDVITESWFGHHTGRRGRYWEPDEAKLVDWSAMNRLSRRILGHLKKNLVASKAVMVQNNRHERPVLKHALAEHRRGLRLMEMGLSEYEVPWPPRR